MSLLSFLGHFKGLFKESKHVVIDDDIFRLHYKVSFYLFLFVSFLCTGIKILGKPIWCTLAYKDWDYMIPQPMFNTFCFIHSTFIIPYGAGAVNVQDQLYPYPGVGHLRDASGMIIMNLKEKIYLQYRNRINKTREIKL